MSRSSQTSYITGGTVPGDAIFYIERDADKTLHEALKRGEFCYVLTPRQMGKSSLVTHIAQRLRGENVATAIIDLQKIGTNLSPKQWYLGLLDSLGRYFRLHKVIDAFAQEHRELSPLQLWQQTLRDIVLPQIAGQIVIFIDEIDTIQGLDFSTDEFFGAIRSCYNSRAESPEYQRLTFCLLGVAAPTDLIRNPRLTPFNIGRRIDLYDFTFEEAVPLQHGLGHDEGTNRLLMERIYFWTDGHPYLTQRLCKTVAENGTILTSKGVDTCCHQMFLAPTTGNRDDNLIYVQQRLIPGEESERAALLTLYQQVWKGKPVADNEANTLVSPLKLSGAVRSVNGILQVRNRIYQQVFDRKWITEQMPGAEKRRQRKAYWSGVLRTAAVFSALLTLFAGLALFAFSQYHRASSEHRRAEQLLYSSDMVVAQLAYDRGEYGRLSQLLSGHRPKSREEDQRGWEWGYYWRLMHQDRHTFTHTGKSIVYSVAFSPDRKTLASADGDGQIKLWDTSSHKEMTPGLKEHGAAIYCLAFCPTNSRLVASGNGDKTVRLWNLASGVAATLPCTDEVRTVAFSSDGRSLAAGCNDGTLIVWSIASRHPIFHQQMFHKNKRGEKVLEPLLSVAFSPDGQTLAAGYGSGRVQLHKAPFTQSTDLAVPRDSPGVYAIAYSPNGKTLAVGKEDGKTEIWNVSSQHIIRVLKGHTANVNGLSFSPNGRYLATGSWDNTVRLWNVTKGAPDHTFIGHSNRVTSVAFAPDGKTLASAADNEVKLWDAQRWEENPRVIAAASERVRRRNHLSIGFTSDGALQQIVVDDSTHLFTLTNLADYQGRWRCHAPENHGGVVLSPDGNTLAMGRDDGTVTLRNIETGKEITTFQAIPGAPGANKGVFHLAYSPNGKTLAVAGGDPASVTVWDVASLQQIGRFQHANSAQGIAFSPDGKTLAVANWQGLVYLWDTNLHRGEVQANDLISWRAHSKPVTDVAFSADAKTLATGSEDHTVKLWNVATRREMITLRDHTDNVQGVAFSPDGITLATTGFDNTVRLYYAARPTGQ